MISKKKIIISLVTVFIFYLNAAAQYSLTLSIDEAKSKIRREIYGALLENWGRDIYGGLYVGRNSSIPNTNGMRNDIIEGLKECGISTLEFPGGCFADQYHWRDGIGSPDSRPGGDSKNGMGTDEYMQLCSLINAEPYFCANLKTGTPQEMAEWINYINKNSSHPDWYCKYWSMGNEPWGCGGDLTAAQFANQYAKFVEAIPDIEGKPQVRIAGAGHWSTDWVKAVFDKNPGKLEGFSVHRYLVNNWNDLAGPSINYNDFQYHQIIQLAFDASSFIRSFDQAMDQYDKDKKIGLMYNEWGAWYDEISSQGYTFSQSTVRDALIAAIHLNAFNNYCERVHLACVAQPVNVIQSIFLTDKNDQTRVVKTPVFYAFKLFKVHQNAKKIPVNLQTASFNEKNTGH
ncbi:MAG TPA: alpha-L-arabinofuranosidase C-terminal domain-containing protein [Chitinispirillaceae bacterium]|nr:alpha-L-arabinofuranosidase C-terminal domain-containing protein [Chitinispirillaceae bacterium]